MPNLQRRNGCWWFGVPGRCGTWNLLITIFCIFAAIDFILGLATSVHGLESMDSSQGKRRYLFNLSYRYSAARRVQVALSGLLVALLLIASASSSDGCFDVTLCWYLLTFATLDSAQNAARSCLQMVYEKYFLNIAHVHAGCFSDCSARRLSVSWVSWHAPSCTASIYGILATLPVSTSA